MTRIDPLLWLRDPRTAEILRKVNAVTVATDNLSAAVDALEGEVKIVGQTILDELAKINAASTDPVVQAAADRITAAVATLAASVAATTGPTPAA